MQNNGWLGLVLLLALGLTAGPARAQRGGMDNPLLDRLVGEWAQEGTIAGERTTHDLDIERVLGHYVRVHEVSRETDASGRPAYEAIVFIGWDEASGRYVCLWLDTTGGEGLSNGVLGFAPPTPDSLPFVFRLPDGGVIETTFTYHRDADRWSVTIDVGDAGALRPFARLTLARK